MTTQHTDLSIAETKASSPRFARSWSPVKGRTTSTTHALPEGDDVRIEGLGSDGAKSRQHIEKFDGHLGSRRAMTGDIWIENVDAEVAQ
jgi:hypothetical protein